MDAVFDRNDQAWIESRGLSLDQARSQLARLARGPRYVELVRPCALGDGVVRLDPRELPRFEALHQESAGRWSRFVPASGAATRMFGALLGLRGGRGPDLAELRLRAASGEAAARDAVLFVEWLEQFAFHAELARACARRGADLARAAARGDYGPILDALLAPDGLDFERRPKALVPFHAYPEGARTAFEEQLIEAAAGASGCCRVHFTVAPHQLETFEAFAARAVPEHERRVGVRIDVGFSVQDPATDTLAARDGGRPARDADGRLIFRPGGHGALLANLAGLGGDLVAIRNIDNVQPEPQARRSAGWRRALAGYLVWLERQGAAGDRPRRVCGVVVNRGEPGGGPFWVRRSDGEIAPRIVEAAEVDPDDPEQQRIFAAASYFNPVEIACALRGASGRPFDLERFVDSDSWIFTRRVEGGAPLLGLERPGLWNGAMAGWDTAFVELPIETFSPVKTVIDLLRPEHQPGPGDGLG